MGSKYHAAWYKKSFVLKLKKNINIIWISVQKITIYCLFFLSRDLSENKLKELTIDAFNYLPNLQILKLSHNSIKDINTKTFQKLKSLMSLDLGYNALSNLFDIHNNDLETLKILILHKNLIQNIPEKAFHNMPNLETL